MSSKKQREILATGRALFLKHGFKRVTIEEICAEAKVSKMTFYKHFSNKMELVKAIVIKMGEEAMDRYRKIMKRDIPFTEKIELQIQMKMEDTSEMSSEFINDLLVHGEPEIMQFMTEQRKHFLGIVHADYVEAQEKGEIRKDVKPEFIIYFLNHLNDMLQDETLINMYKDPYELAMELIRFFFYGITHRDEKTQ
jgi:AcrR family transcriptional regulator